MADTNFIDEMKYCSMARGVWRFACTLAGVLVMLSLCQLKIRTQRGNKPDLTEENRYMARNLLQDNEENIRVSCATYICRGNPWQSHWVLFPLSKKNSKFVCT